MNPLYSLTGLLVGILVGMTGMGGGSLMTPLLILILHVKPTVAVGSDLAYAAITKIFGSWQHRTHGQVNTDLVYRMAMGSVPGSLLGVFCLNRMQAYYGISKGDGHDPVQSFVTHSLGYMLIVVSLAMLARSTGLISKWRLRGNRGQRRKSYVWSISIGLVLGFIVGVTSVGSGTLFGVAMIAVFGLGAREMVGTDVYHGALLTIAAAMGHVWNRDVNYTLVGNLLIGSIPGVLIGSRLATRMPEKALRPTLAIVLLLSGIKMI